jgi:hypothetical protein
MSTVITGNSGITSESLAPDIKNTSGGAVLFVKSTSSTSIIGAEVRDNGQMVATVDSGAPIVLNRTGADGMVINVLKDGGAHGQIGTAEGDMYIGTGNTGILFRDGFRSIYPANPTSTNHFDATDAINIGQPTNRFKDLYLSGGVFLGGTAGANKLDDYEEGVYTPEFRVGGTAMDSGDVANIEGKYTKIGRIVIVHFRLGQPNFTSSGLTGSVSFSLPFVVSEIMSTTAVQAPVTFAWMSGVASDLLVSAAAWEPYDEVRFGYSSGVNASSVDTLSHATLTDTFDFRASVVYMTNE